MAGSHPDFAIVGAPKAGTTSLHAWLGEHPGVYLPPAKELHFFDVHRGRGVDWYAKQFAPAGTRLAGEATTAYLSHPTAVEELAKLNPEIRIIVIVREPVARAWSHYNYGVARSWFTEPFEVMITRELGALLEGREDANGLINQGRYGHHLTRASVHVSSERICVLDHERLMAHPDQSFTNVCRFLGLDHGVRPSNLQARENATRHVRYPRTFRLILRSRLDRALPDRARQRLAMLLSAPGYPQLDPALADALSVAFEGDQRMLEPFISRAGIDS